MARKHSTQLCLRIVIAHVRACITKPILALAAVLFIFILLSTILSTRRLEFRFFLNTKHKIDIEMIGASVTIITQSYHGTDEQFEEFLDNHSESDGWSQRRAGFNWREDEFQSDNTKLPEYENWSATPPVKIRPGRSVSDCKQYTATMKGHLLKVPYWLIWAPAFLWLELLLYRRLTQFRSYCCRMCSFNLRDNQSGICPECGTPLSQLNQTMIDASSK